MELVCPLTNRKSIFSLKGVFFSFLFYKSIKKQNHKNILCPEFTKIFRAYNYFNIKDTKVVIIAQDPYHTPCIASGLAFESLNIHYTPPSLLNIYKEIRRTEKVLIAKPICIVLK